MGAYIDKKGEPNCDAALSRRGLSGLVHAASAKGSPARAARLVSLICLPILPEAAGIKPAGKHYVYWL
ncbi:hypothetical protein GCM10017643_31710 [Ancylobacter dichloromethanicus]|uniref:Uncharacterized protein n=1 Tax=Ancylobacter dichloromethanicus TaxID=518825 RepID=A0A9W6JBZ2_9HYPH|nr:hypothetical protein GCM10017643_31710 [Ancylobacter dichloromethanicus]